MKIYVASSWRNLQQQSVVDRLRVAGHEVYDFKNPHFGATRRGFSWRDIDPDWEKWTAKQQIKAYEHELATHGLGADLAGMVWADAFIMVQPAGRSAALELGWAIGRDKYTAVLMADGGEPELMIRLAHFLATDIEDIMTWLENLK